MKEIFTTHTPFWSESYLENNTLIVKNFRIDLIDRIINGFKLFNNNYYGFNVKKLNETNLAFSQKDKRPVDVRKLKRYMCALLNDELSINHLIFIAALQALVKKDKANSQDWQEILISAEKYYVEKFIVPKIQNFIDTFSFESEKFGNVSFYNRIVTFSIFELYDGTIKFDDCELNCKLKYQNEEILNVSSQETRAFDELIRKFLDDVIDSICEIRK